MKFIISVTKCRQSSNLSKLNPGVIDWKNRNKMIWLNSSLKYFPSTSPRFDMHETHYHMWRIETCKPTCVEIRITKIIYREKQIPSINRRHRRTVQSFENHRLLILQHRINFIKWFISIYLTTSEFLQPLGLKKKQGLNFKFVQPIFFRLSINLITDKFSPPALVFL